jgi:hypothetical protein
MLFLLVLVELPDNDDDSKAAFWGDIHDVQNKRIQSTTESNNNKKRDLRLSYILLLSCGD